MEGKLCGGGGGGGQLELIVMRKKFIVYRKFNQLFLKK